MSVFNKTYPPGSVPRCPTAAENGGYDQGGFDLPRLRRITNISSSSCANNRRRTQRWVFDACRRSSRLCFSHFATHTVDNTVDLYAAKPDIRPELRFLPTPPAFDVPVRAVPVGISPPRLVWKTRMVWQLDGENISKICLFILT